MSTSEYNPRFSIQNLIEFHSIQYPGIVENVDNMMKTLGGPSKISEVICDPNRRMQLWFRPDDRFSKPVNGNRRPSSALIMKVRVKKKTQKIYMAIQDGVNIYKDVVPSSLDPDWFKTTCPYFLVPPIFLRVDSVQNYYFSKDKVSESGQSSKVISSTRRKRYGLARFLGFEDTEVPTCPRKSHPQAQLTTNVTSDQSLVLLRKLFEERPIYSKTALAAISKIAPKELKVLVPHVAYHFNNGPWRAMWVQFGHDPRKDPASCKYQTLDFRFRKADEDPKIQAKRSHRSSVVPRIARKPGTIPETVAKDDYIFYPGKLPPYRQYFYQICDVHLQEVQTMLASAELRTTCDIVDGWLPAGMNRTFRTIMGQYINEETTRRQCGGAVVTYSEPSASSESEDESLHL